MSRDYARNRKPRADNHRRPFDDDDELLEAEQVDTLTHLHTRAIMPEIEVIPDESSSTTNVYKDLQTFLLSPRVDLRQAATEAVLQSVRDSQQVVQLLEHDIVAALAKNVNHPDATVAVNALQALVYLSSSSGPTANLSVEHLLDAGGMNRMMEIVLSSIPKTNDNDEQLQKQWRDRVNYAMALVANMTRTERGAIDLVGRSLPEEAVMAVASSTSVKIPEKPTMELLLARFLNPQYIVEVEQQADEDDAEHAAAHDKSAKLDSSSHDPFQHFAATLMNVTQVEVGRNFLLKLTYASKNDGTGSAKLQTLLPFLTHSNPIRRRGVAGAIRNCCVDTDSVWWMLNVVNITKHLLYPLAGPEELDLEEKQGLDVDLWMEGPDKVREVDHLTRLFLVEALYLLCKSGRTSRRELKRNKVNVILRLAEMVEEHEDVTEKMNLVMELLREDGEEDDECDDDDDVDGDDVQEDLTRRPVAARQVGAAASDFDGVD